ncbi:MAG: hypothetical protein KC517_04605 [Bacteroidetes bacterium]|jgi:hypothetical protein|nr:hypothetical protein [Bacteroidota bacterium]
MTCSTKKNEYDTIEAAEVALIDTRIRFLGNAAVNVYQCEICGLWHLTSRGVVNVKLQEMIDSGALEEEIKKFEWRERYT